MGDPRERLLQFLQDVSEAHPNDPVAQSQELRQFYEEHGQAARDAFRGLIEDPGAIAEITHQANRAHRRAGVRIVGENEVGELLEIIGQAAEENSSVDWAVRSRLFEEFD